MTETPNVFKISKAWFSWAYEQPDIKPYHTALLFWILDKANRSGWKEAIDMQTDWSMETLGIGTYKTYKKALQELHDFGVIDWFYRSKNQYTGCSKVKICFGFFDQSTTKALSKAMTKQSQSTDQSTTKAEPPYINLQTSKPVNLQTSKPEKIHAQAFDSYSEILKMYRPHLEQFFRTANFEYIFSQWHLSRISTDKNWNNAKAMTADVQKFLTSWEKNEARDKAKTEPPKTAKRGNVRPA